MAAAKKTRDTEIVVAPAPQLPGMTVANVREELDRSTDPAHVESIRAQAAGMREALRSPAAAEIVGCDDAAEIRRRLLDMAESLLWAKRRLGELLPKPHPGERTDLGGGTSPTLGEVGHGELGRWRELAAVPIAAFEAAIIDARQAGREPTQTALLKLAPPKPKREPKKPRAHPVALTRAQKLALKFVRELHELTDGEPDGAHDVRYGARAVELLLLGQAADDELVEVVGLFSDSRPLLERGEVHVLSTAAQLERDVLSKLAEDSNEQLSVEGLIERLREDASEMERVRTGAIAPKSTRDTSYATRFKIPKGTL